MKHSESTNSKSANHYLISVPNFKGMSKKSARTATVALLCASTTVFQSCATRDSLQLLGHKKSHCIVQSDSGLIITNRNVKKVFNHLISEQKIVLNK